MALSEPPCKQKDGGAELFLSYLWRRDVERLVCLSFTTAAELTTTPFGIYSFIRLLIF